MSPLAIRLAIRRSRRSLALVAVLVAVTAAVAVHHAVPMTMDGMDGMGGMGGGTIVCLAVVAIVAAAAISSLAPRVRLFPRFTHAAKPQRLLTGAPRSMPARAGPLQLQVLRL